MIEGMQYTFWGCIHIFILAFEFLDYIEQALIGILILFFVIIAMWDREFIKMYLNIGKTFLKMIFSLFGIILLITMASYYCFSIFAFEDNINILILIITLALFCKDLYEFMNNSILDENKKTINSIIEMSESVFILFFYRLLYVIETRNFNELNKVMYSLIFIPIIAIIIIIMKILTTVETITIEHFKTEKLDNIEYLKLFLVVLKKEKSINNTNKIISCFFKSNKMQLYDEAKQGILKCNNDNIQNEKEEIKVQKNKGKKKFKVKSIIFIIWIISILTTIYSIIAKRFFNFKFDIKYYLSLVVLSIYFIGDIMKIYRIECQYDFIIYFFISIVEYIILLIYYIQIQNGRLSNMLFLVIIYIIVATLFRENKTMKFLDMPFLSEKNFFGLEPKEKP